VTGHDAIVPADASTAADLDALESRTAFREWGARPEGQRADPSRFGMLCAALGVDLERLGSVSGPSPALGVVGSKGKGTTVAFASALLVEAGLRVGTVFSPGLVSNRDRLRVDGAVLPLAEYVALLERVDAALRTLPPPTEGYLGPSGFFLAAGLAHFAAEGCDALVLEAGIGGRRDDLGRVGLTGLAMAEVFLEHTDLLGGTIGAIAGDKVGAARPGAQFITHLAQSKEAEAVIRAHAEAIGAELLRVDPVVRESYADAVGPGFGGMNAAHGMHAARRLLAELARPDATAEQVRAAGARVRYPGRLSRHALPGTTVYVDSAISRDGFENALAHVERETGAPPPLTLVSVPRTKDLAGFREVAAGLRGRVLFIALERVHLHYPERSEWPGEWAAAAELPTLLRSAPVVLAVGTASFSAEVLRQLGVDTERVL
jgi:dihydrofolate synthase/folylpolyglutamate synthase